MKHTYHYFDYAAGTPLDPKVQAAMEPFFRNKFYNPSANYQPARDVKKELNSARDLVASICGLRASGVVFTAGVTEANTIFTLGLAAQYPGSHLLYSAIEHESVLEPMLKAAELFGCEVESIPVDENGSVDPNEVTRRVRDTTVGVSVMLINNEIGVVQDVPGIARALKEIKSQRSKKDAPLYLHSDIAQAPAHMKIDMNTLGLDAASLSAAKVYGPKQTGALLLAPQVQLTPILVGGGQEKGLRAGTENVANSVALSVALQQVEALRSSEEKRLLELRDKFESLLTTQSESIIINAQSAIRAPHISSVLLPGVDGERMVMELEERGFLVATGSACNAADEDPSHVIQALGRSREQAAATLRISLGRDTTLESVEALAKNMLELTQ